MALRALLSTLLALVVGVAIRLAWADALEGPVAGWEADAFVRAAEGRPDSLLDAGGAWNRLRPPLPAWVHHPLGEALGLRTVPERRLGAIGVSLACLLCAFVLALSVGSRTRAGVRSVPGAAAAVGWGWALLPTLGALSIRPGGDLLAGAGLCLLLAGIAQWRGGTMPFGIVLAAAGAAIAVLAGGIVVLAALLLGTLVYLVPLPAPTRALGALLVAATAVAAAWYGSKGPTSDRPLRPDSGALHGLADLAGVRPAPEDQVLPSFDAREARLLARVRDAVDAMPAGELAGRYATRAFFDTFSARRFAELARVPPAATGLLDAFLRGGLLLYAAAVAGSLRRRQTAGTEPPRSSFPRAAVALGLLTWLLLAIAGATHPFVLGPLDLVLVGLAGAGMAGAGEGGRGTRRVAFVVGGVLLVAPTVAGLVTERPLAPWLLTLGQDEARAARAVALLEREALDAEAHLELSATLQHDALPFLRLPEAALAHALAASTLAPLDLRVTRAIAFAYVEALDFDTALALAEETYALAGPDDKEARVLLDGVTYEKRLHDRSVR